MFMPRIKDLRTEHNITQKELADYLGVTAKAISFYELGQRELSYQHLYRLSQKFDVSIDYLLGKSNIRKEIVNSSEVNKAAKIAGKILASKDSTKQEIVVDLLERLLTMDSDQLEALKTFLCVIRK